MLEPGTATVMPDSRGFLPSRLPFGGNFHRKLLDSLYDGVYFVDTERRILFWSRGAERLSGYAAAEVVGNVCYANILDHSDADGCNLCVAHCPLVSAMNGGQTTSHRIYLRHKDGRRIAVDVTVLPVRDDSGRIVGGAEVFEDASETLALESAYARLRQLAEKDPLTDIANRRHLDAMLAQQMDLLRRTGIHFSVILADLDHFKRINDTFGHGVGDQVLIRFSSLLQSSCRSSDVVGRFGGEEFLVILPGHGLAPAVHTAERIRKSCESLHHQALQASGLTTSLGIAEADRDDDVSSLLARADRALYMAKEGGRNRAVALSIADAGHSGVPDASTSRHVDEVGQTA